MKRLRLFYLALLGYRMEFFSFGFGIMALIKTPLRTKHMGLFEWQGARPFIIDTGMRMEVDELKFFCEYLDLFLWYSRKMPSELRSAILDAKDHLQMRLLILNQGQDLYICNCGCSGIICIFRGIRMELEGNLFRAIVTAGSCMTGGDLHRYITLIRLEYDRLADRGSEYSELMDAIEILLDKMGREALARNRVEMTEDEQGVAVCLNGDKLVNFAGENAYIKAYYYMRRLMKTLRSKGQRFKFVFNEAWADARAEVVNYDRIHVDRLAMKGYPTILIARIILDGESVDLREYA